MTRSEFVYYNGYGKTTDIHLLSIGTKFTVSNGGWEGKIVEVDGVKFLLVITTDKLIELDKNHDYGLVIYNVRNDSEVDVVNQSITRLHAEKDDATQMITFG